MATLFLVSTPIGNLDDITLRAKETLTSVSRVLVEDTRRTRTLLDHLEIRTPMVSLHAHNEAAREEAVLGWLGQGEDLALVSDAGTPLISDPGHRLVAAAIDAGHTVVPIPGPSAALAALVASGLPCDRFSFFGFLPRKGPERDELLDRATGAEDTSVIFESPDRLTSLLEVLEERCGPDRGVAVARELTKLHEEVIRGSLSQVRDHFGTHPPRGEVVLVLSPSHGSMEEEEAVDEAAVRALAQALLDQGIRPSRAARDVAQRLRLPRNLCYRIVQDVARSDPHSR